MKFVVVDGDQEALRGTECSLAGAFPSAEVVCFPDALGAYKYCANHTNEISLAFISVLLKPFDGLKLSEMLSKLPAPIVAVMMLREDSDELLGLLTLKGNCWHIVKPVTKARILEVAREVADDCLNEGRACENCMFIWCDRKTKRMD